MASRDGASGAGRPRGARVTGSVGVVVPAHDEEELLPGGLAALREAAAVAEAERPGLRVRIVVAADACSDGTAALARQAGVTVVKVSARNVGVARAAGLPPPRVRDLVLAAGELTANSVRHAGGSGILRIWSDAREFSCEVADGGYIGDPLAGRLQPAPGAAGGHGLWIVHQVCDLVELRSGRDGTTIRLHMSLP